MKSQDCPLTISFVISAKTNRPNTTISINKRLNPMNNQISASSYLSRKSLILPEDHEKNTDMCCHVHDRKRLREATLPFLSFLFSDLKLLGSDRDGILLPYNSTTGRGFPLLSLSILREVTCFMERAPTTGNAMIHDITLPQYGHLHLTFSLGCAST